MSDTTNTLHEASADATWLAKTLGLLAANATSAPGEQRERDDRRLLRAAHDLLDRIAACLPARPAEESAHV
ncbi:hypothetical protein [Microbacterium sp. 16-032]|uniref:hypothetical protein n=1 Tax=Microbacterium sp. 16-032 TaxID=3239808 RepID=UPI0034E250CA